MAVTVSCSFISRTIVDNAKIISFAFQGSFYVSQKNYYHVNERTEYLFRFTDMEMSKFLR